MDLVLSQQGLVQIGDDYLFFFFPFLVNDFLVFSQRLQCPSIITRTRADTFDLNSRCVSLLLEASPCSDTSQRHGLKPTKVSPEFPDRLQGVETSEHRALPSLEGKGSALLPEEEVLLPLPI